MTNTTTTDPVLTPGTRPTNLALVLLFMNGALSTASLDVHDRNILRHRVIRGYHLTAVAAMMGAGWTASEVRQREIRALAALGRAWSVTLDLTVPVRHDAPPCQHKRTTFYYMGEQCDDCGHWWAA